MNLKQYHLHRLYSNMSENCCFFKLYKLLEKPVSFCLIFLSFSLLSALAYTKAPSAFYVFWCLSRCFKFSLSVWTP